MIRPACFAMALLFALAGCQKPDRHDKPASPQAGPQAMSEQDRVTRMITGDCAGFASVKTFTDWHVTVDFFQTSTVNNAIDVTFGAGNHVRLEAIVMPNDPLYHAVEKLEEGGTARLSGRFMHGNAECAYRLPVGIEVTSAQ